MLVATGKRHVLFLQGPGSLFFHRFSLALEQAGVQVSKIHLCAGDLLFWRSRNAVSYRGSFDDWHGFVERYIVSNGVSDVVLFSDSRPYHRVATNVAKGLGVNVFAFENGYFRPDWITLEKGGVNGRSPFPQTREGVERLAADALDPGEQSIPVRHNARLILGDITFHTVSFFGSFLYPRYRRYRTANPVLETLGWIRRGLSRRGKVARSEARLDALLKSRRPFFLYPLQLDHDFQLSVDSPFSSINEASQAVIASFAHHAPSDAVLLVKNHPRDNNLVNRETDIEAMARRHGIADRVVFIESGSNPLILSRALGMVTINSTMGTSALSHGLPVCALGRAVYNVEGLTFQGTLDQFWNGPVAPDLVFFKLFRRALIHSGQVRGEFGTSDLRDSVFEQCVVRLLVTPYRSAGLALNASMDASSRDHENEGAIRDAVVAGASRRGA